MLMSASIVLAATLVTAAPDAPAAPAPMALSTVALDYDALAAGPRTWDIAMNATSETADGTLRFTGSVTMETRVTDDTIVLRDDWTIMGRSYALTTICERAPLLPLHSMQVTMSRGDRTDTAALAVEGETARMTSGASEVEMPFPAGTLLEAAAFRIVPQLPRTPGQQYTFPAIAGAIEVRAQAAKAGAPFTLTCDGPAVLTVDGAEVACTRFTLAGQKTMQLFVDDAARLCRMVADGGSTVMVARPEVMTVTETESGAPE